MVLASLVWGCQTAGAVRGPFSGVERKYIRPPLRAVLKALILLHFQRVLFLHISPVFPCPGPLAPFGPFCGAGRAVKGVVPGRSKRPPALPAPPRPDTSGASAPASAARSRMRSSVDRSVIIVRLFYAAKDTYFFRFRSPRERNPHPSQTRASRPTDAAARPNFGARFAQPAEFA